MSTAKIRTYCGSCGQPVGEYHRATCPEQAAANRLHGSSATAMTVSRFVPREPVVPPLPPDPPTVRGHVQTQAVADASGTHVHTPGQAVPVTRPESRARATDPSTSKKGAEDVTVREGSQKGKLLRAYYRVDEEGVPDGVLAAGVQPERALGGDTAHGMTNEEAGGMSGLAEFRGCCYWKRCGELLAGGLIEVMTYDSGHPVIRYSRAGSEQRVCRITDKGRAMVRSWS